MHARISLFPRSVYVAVAGIGLALTPHLTLAQGDPPPGSAQLDHIQGDISVQYAGSDQWGQAADNLPLGPGDRVFADPQSSTIGRLQADQARAYFAPGADLTLTAMDDRGVEFGLGAGSAFFYSDGFGQGQGLFINTPNGAVAVVSRAGFRVDIYPDQQSTVITNYATWDSDPIRITGGGGFVTMLNRGQSIQLTGTNPVYAQPLAPEPGDLFARRANAIEGQHENAISLRYVSPEMNGYAELDDAGQWQPQSDYGPIWFPRVEAGWAPYHNGHWVNRPFFGWTWVADEPWGEAPFHYGRWVVLGGRWGWIPGPRTVRPIWSPAQVVFAGGVQVGGVGVSVWFPLGPGEAYKPWYPCSPQYINRVNITNIQESRVVHVQTTYVNVVNVTNVTYVNRTVGVTAMRQEDFAAGHSAKAVAVKIDPRQVEHVQVAAPAAQPPAHQVPVHPVAKPPAVQAQRPVLINHQGQQVTAVANARPVAVPVKAAPPAPRPLPGRTPAGNAVLGGKPVAPAPPAPAVKPGQTMQPAKPGEPAMTPKPQTPPAKTVPTAPAKVFPAAPAAQKPPVKAETPAAQRPAPAARDAKKDPKDRKDEKKPPQKPE